LKNRKLSSLARSLVANTIPKTNGGIGGCTSSLRSMSSYLLASSIHREFPARMVANNTMNLQQRRTMFIQTESTPNPNGIKFLPTGKRVLPEEFGSSMVRRKPCPSYPSLIPLSPPKYYATVSVVSVSSSSNICLGSITTNAPVLLLPSRRIFVRCNKRKSHRWLASCSRSRG